MEQDLSGPARRVPERDATERAAEILPHGRRMPAFSVTNLFATPRSEIWDMKGITYSFEQKLSRSFQRHLLKAVPLHERNRWTPEPGEPFVHVSDVC